MMVNWSLKDLKGLIKNPLDFILLFVFLSFSTFISLMIINANVSDYQTWTLLITLIIVFPVLSLVLFAYLTIFQWGKLFSPDQRSKYVETPEKDRRLKLKREAMEDKESFDDSTGETEQNLYQKHAEIEYKTLKYIQKLYKTDIEKNRSVYSVLGFSVELDGVAKIDGIKTGIEIRYTKSGRILEVTISRLSDLADKLEKMGMQFMILIVSEKELQGTTKTRLQESFGDKSNIKLKCITESELG